MSIIILIYKLNLIEQVTLKVFLVVYISTALLTITLASFVNRTFAIAQYNTAEQSQNNTNPDGATQRMSKE